MISPERMGYLQGLRALSAALVLFSGAYASRAIGVDLESLWIPTALYLGLLGVSDVLRRRNLLKRAVVVAMLAVDGFYLAWIAYLSGGIESPLRFLIY
ncbi:MAG: hypothetical protein LC808_11560, partial [Actinobacteria bacterium]|nr:hypothetical protein [Actinomycetota bacterium]